MTSAFLTLVVSGMAYMIGRRSGRRALLREQGEEAERIWQSVREEMFAPPLTGDLHFRDGPIRVLWADSVSDALDKLQRNA